jgi:hypothetical protein
VGKPELAAETSTRRRAEARHFRAPIPRCTLPVVQFDDVLRTLADFFERERIPFALIGGLAMQSLGYSRFTRDADFVVGRENRDATVAFLQSVGYETLHVSEGYSNHLHAEKAFGRVDLMYVDPATASALFPAAVTRPVVGTVSLPVAHPNHLAAMKALAMKNAPERVLDDSPDVRYLLSLEATDPINVPRDIASTAPSCSMQSKDAPEPLDFPGVPTTAEDIAALSHVKAFDRMDPQQYLEFLLAFTDRHPPTREIPPNHEPFRL